MTDPTIDDAIPESDHAPRPNESRADVGADRRVHRIRIGDDEYIALSIGIPETLGHDDAHLTDAERAVAALVREGRSNQEIARVRGGSVRTVANHVAAILRKCGVASRAELVARTHREIACRAAEISVARPGPSAARPRMPMEKLR